jgi:DNA-binding MarR family transcriptional regulator
MQPAEAVIRVQSAYPRIYLACHSHHQTARTTDSNLSQRDSAILSHLNEHTPVQQSDLARHLSLAKSTLSEALSWLEECGFIRREPRPGDTRGAILFRTAAGTAAMSSSSVLETEKLMQLVQALNDDERARAVEGLELLAKAAEKTCV